MKRPVLHNYIKVITVIDGKDICGVDYVSYAFALEDYILYLEKQLKGCERNESVE